MERGVFHHRRVPWCLCQDFAHCETAIIALYEDKGRYQERAQGTIPCDTVLNISRLAKYLAT